MIQLQLTLAELTLIQEALTQLPEQECHSLQTQELLDKLAIAHSEAIRFLICPVCQSTFTQLKTGRTASYCSTACKQKAYRQRCNRARRQFGPRRHAS